MKTYGYIRVSTEEQLKGDGIQRQKRLIREYVRSENLAKVEFLIDEGKSAFSGANMIAGELGRFINKVETGAIKTPCNLIVENVDRLSRDDPDEAQYQVLRMTRAGVSIHVIGSEGKSRRVLKRGMSLADILLTTVDQVRSNLESLAKQERLQGSWETKRKEARESKKPMSSSAQVGWS